MSAEILALPSKPLKAYKVTEPCEGAGGIVFARFNAEARRNGACEHGDGDFDSVECRRAPEFDQYAPGPVPDYALSDHGWFLWCKCGCGRKIEDGRIVVTDGYDDDGERDWESDREHPAWLDKRDGSLWCSRWGPMRLAEQRAKRGWGRRMARVMARFALPDDCWFYLDEKGRDDGNSRDGVYIGEREYYGPPAPVEQWGRSRWGQGLSMPRQRYDKFICAFKFPGAKYWATWESDNPDHPWVCNGDLFAYWVWRGMEPEKALRLTAQHGNHMEPSEVDVILSNPAVRKAAA